MIAVLIIISIIAAIVVPRFFDFDKSSTKVAERFEQKSNERVDFVNEMNEKMKGEK
jgi:type II secretory pathway pseudopilin PulG